LGGASAEAGVSIVASGFKLVEDPAPIVASGARFVNEGADIDARGSVT